jgi:predicted TIM-barrel fold metal-dependent hydrolase
MGRILRDADSHLMELPDFLTAHADPSVRDRLPPLYSSDTGATVAELPRDGRRAHPPDVVARLTALGDQLLKGPKWHAALGAFDAGERSRVLDLLGIERQIVFSSFSAFALFSSADIDVRYGGARAHNRAMVEFVADDPRLSGTALLVLDDPERSAHELDHALAAGLRLFWLPSSAPGRSPGHRDHDRIWARLAEARAAFVLHVGSTAPAIEPEWMNDGVPGHTTARGGAEVVGAKDMTTMHHSAERFLSVLILDGVLDRFPDLRGGCIELGAGWVPAMRHRLDNIVDIWSRAEPHLAEMNRRPSEQIDDQLRFTPYPFEDVGNLIRQSSDRLYLFSTDYPHAEGGRDPIGRFEAKLVGLPASATDRFFSGNFADLVRQ